MRSSSGSDISDLEEERKQESGLSISSNRRGLFEESEFDEKPQYFYAEIKNISIGEPQKVKEGRDGYFIYPILEGNVAISHHRYKEFVWLRNELSIHYPACATPALPEKEGVIGYWTSQDLLFYKFRRFGLEKFLQRVIQHPKLSKSPDLHSFLKDDDINFHLRMKKSESNKGWYGLISEWSVSIAGLVSGYISSESNITHDEGDFEFSNYRNEIKLLYQQQETLCAQGRSLVTCEENEISSNVALSKAYENMGKVEKEGLSEKLKVLAETHLSISDAHKSSFDKLKELVGQEMENYKRICFGLLEALERRDKIKSDRNLSNQYDLREINQDLKKELNKFNQEKAYLSNVISQQLIEYKYELTEKISEVWREAYNKISV